MAQKPRSEWSEAYRRRVERAEAQGKTRQAARGHKAREHVARAQRSKQAGKLTSADRQLVKRFATRQAYRMEVAFAPVHARMLEWIADFGMQTFRQLTHKVDRLHREYIRQLEKGTYDSGGYEALASYAFDYEPIDHGWLYYHN